MAKYKCDACEQFKRSDARRLTCSAACWNSPEYRHKRSVRRFWERVAVDEKTGCLVASGGGHQGYVNATFQFLGDRRPTVYGMHRASLVVHGIPLVKGLVVDHMCRNPSCCNPDHLRQVTQGVNAIENNNSPPAINKAKTHCKRGHPFDSENTIHVSNGRKCRICTNAKDRRKYWRKKERAIAARAGVPCRPRGHRWEYREISRPPFMCLGYTCKRCGERKP